MDAFLRQNGQDTHSIIALCLFLLDLLRICLP
jgi:hypothetical protein